MLRNGVWLHLAAGLAACSSLASAQTRPSAAAPPPDAPTPAVYASFLRQVAEIAEIDEPAPAPTASQPGRIARIPPRQALGLTEQEARALTELAVDYAAEGDLLDDARRRLTFERRLHAISSQEVPEQLSRALRDLEESRARIVADHVQRLEQALGAERFRAVNEYIRSRQKEASFFTEPPDPNRPVPKKVGAAVKK